MNLFNIECILVVFSESVLYKIKFVVNKTLWQKTKTTLLWILKILAVILCTVLVFVGAGLATVPEYIQTTYGTISFEQILFTLAQSGEQTAAGTAESARSIATTLLSSAVVLAFVVLAGLIICMFRLREKRLNRAIIISLCGSVIFCALGFMNAANSVDFFGYLKRQQYSSEDFYEYNYVDAQDVEFDFPEKKRNLVYIILESMEETFKDTAHGGAMEQNLIPNLTEIQNENLTFTQNRGLTNSFSTGCTVYSLVAQTSGTPLIFRPLSEATVMLPGTVTITDILADNGYEQTFLIGSNEGFDSRGEYFRSHGDVAVKDYYYALEEEWIPEGYDVWWGYEDDKLFDFAKEELTRLSESGDPFAFYTLTTDTHFPDGYICPDCPDKFDKQYFNAIYCSDKKAAEFIRWIQKQPWYENTTIVVTGDHPTMNSDLFGDISRSGYERSVFHTIINPGNERAVIRDIQATPFDLFPTTLSSLGVKMSSNQLGFGVDLFSGETTLAERYGASQFSNLIFSKSPYYEHKLWKDQRPNKDSNGNYVEEASEDEA